MKTLCSTRNNKVPNEGAVIRTESLDLKVFKQKCFKFLEKETKELDKEIMDIESAN